MSQMPREPEVITNNRFEDERGYFQEWFNRQKLVEIYGIDFDPRQANISVSSRNVIRGMHFGIGSNDQSKLVMCASGTIVDVTVNIDKNSENFRQIHKFTLSSENFTSIFIPAGFAHGFEVISDSATVVYLQSREYAPDLEYAINPMDPDLGIIWSTTNPILSRRDSESSSLKDYTNR